MGEENCMKTTQRGRTFEKILRTFTKDPKRPLTGQPKATEGGRDGSDLPGAHRWEAAVFVRAVRHLPDEPERANLDAVHWRHRKGIPLQQSRQPQIQRRASAPDADGSPHRAGRLLQELQREAGLGLRVRHRGQPALQGGKGHSREGARQRTGRHRRGQPQDLDSLSSLATEIAQIVILYEGSFIDYRISCAGSASCPASRPVTYLSG